MPAGERYVVQQLIRPKVWQTIYLVGDDPEGLTRDQAIERAKLVDPAARIGVVNCWRLERVRPGDAMIWGGQVLPVGALRRVGDHE